MVKSNCMRIEKFKIRRITTYKTLIRLFNIIHAQSWKKFNNSFALRTFCKTFF